jgi:poly-gamma-glutamate synthesis protein (capsule biosynthesis protein)
MIAADVAAAREAADLVIVLLHSGYEDQQTPNTIQRRAAHAAIDAGAALVLGSHPHVLQGVEYYNGGVIAYSLGNFVFDGLAGPRAESVIMNVTLTRDGVQSVEWTPVTLRSGRPFLATGNQAKAILAKLERLTAALNR